MMFKYWHLILLGVICMLLFALFNGVSITLVIPLFDYVFNPAKNQILYPDYQSFLSAAGELLSRHFHSQSGFLAALQNWGQLWDNAKELMLLTSSLACLCARGVCISVHLFQKPVLLSASHPVYKLRGKTIRDIPLYFLAVICSNHDFFGQNRVGDAIVRRERCGNRQRAVYKFHEQRCPVKYYGACFCQDRFSPQLPAFLV
jgi:hypothetical protein